MERIILFGTGVFGRRTYEKLKSDGIVPICFVDNDRSKWGSYIDNVEIRNPGELVHIEFDDVVICVNDPIYYNIRCQLIDELDVPEQKIRHWTYRQRIDFLNHYKNSDHKDPIIDRIIDYVEKHDRLSAFNATFADKYSDNISCFLDDSSGLFYTVYNGKKLFLCRKFKSKDQAEEYFRSLMIEQDPASPHRYMDDSFGFDGGCVLDAGAAEGNFALEIVERAEKVLLIEADPTWNEALMKTFEPWKDKVTIINKYLSDVDGHNSVSIDTLAAEQQIDFIKMDIEGAEPDALKGGERYLSKADHVKLAICSYHNLEDEYKIRMILEPLGYEVVATDGHMVFPDNVNQPPRLVRGVLRASR